MGRTSRKRRSKKHKRFNNFPTNDDDLYEKLKSWMLLNNWTAICNLIPQVFQITGRGIMTKDIIEANQIVLQVPKSLLITTRVVSQSSICNLFSTTKSYSAQSVLAIFLIFEKHLDKLSYWKPYLDTLPNSYTNPEFCTKNEKMCLPSFIASDLDTMSKRLKYNYLLLVESIKILHNTVCNHCKQSYFHIFTYHNFLWAFYTVNTRAIYINDKKWKCSSINISGDDNLALAPLLDLFNHTSETVADAQLVSFADSEVYQIKALKSYDANTQVFINYGPHSNYKLYLEYGFFIPNNPLDQIFFNLSDIQKGHEVSALVCNFLKMNNIDKGMAFTIEGLNYNAKIALFVVTSNTSREYLWKEKIYTDTYNSADLRLINQLSLVILENKRKKYLLQYKIMKKIVQKSPSFSIAVSLMIEYIKIIEQSLKNMKSFLYN